MKSNWHWPALAHVMLALVIAIEVGWLVFAAIFLVPKFQKLADDGVIDLADISKEGMDWMPALLDCLYDVQRGYTAWLMLGSALLVGLFEWRVKSENKPFIRLSAWGTVAVGLTVISMLVGAALAVPQLMSGPVTSRMAVTFAKVQTEHIDAALGTLEQALAKEDWDAMIEPAARVSQALYNLDKARPAVRALWSAKAPSVEKLRAHVIDASDIMANIRQDIVQQDADQVRTGLEKLRQSYHPLREAAKLAR